MERREPSQHSLLDPGKPRKTCVVMAGRRTFRILTYSQLSGIKVKAVIRPKYNNLYIVMIQCTHYKNCYTFKASNDNTHKTKQDTQIQGYQLVVNKTLYFINNRPMIYQLIFSKNTIFYDDRKPEAENGSLTGS